MFIRRKFRAVMYSLLRRVGPRPELGVGADRDGVGDYNPAPYSVSLPLTNPKWRVKDLEQRILEMNKVIAHYQDRDRPELVWELENIKGSMVARLKELHKESSNGTNP